jgi:O-antigen ligase
VPFEAAYLMEGTTLSKLFGLALAAFALLQPRLCYAFPPRAFRCFVVYLFIYVVWGSYLILVPPNVPDFNRSFIQSAFRLTQLLVLFWLSYNLMTRERISAGALWALAAGTTLLATFQILGITGNVAVEDRLAAFDEQNPNTLANTLAIGLLALFGLAYGRAKIDWKARLLFWLASGVLVLSMVQTGSRGVVVAAAGALLLFFLRGRSLATKLKIGMIGVVGILALGVASYQIDAVRKRWEKTFYDESFSGREEIYAQAITMILESPLVGWGPIIHTWELGPRVGREQRDEHNLYLWLFAEVGLVGAIPFLAALCLCWRTAWRARHGIQGILPVVMLSFLLVGGLKGTSHNSKLFWVVLSYSLASGSYLAREERSKIKASSRYSSVGLRRGYELAEVAATGREIRMSRHS